MAIKPYYPSPLQNFGQATPIVPSDSTLTLNYKALYIGSTGDVNAILAGTTTAVLFKAVPVGILPVAVTAVFATSTTATNMLGLN